MTRQDQDSFPGLPEPAPLPGDVRDRNGKRSTRSRWTYFRREITVTQEHIDAAMPLDSHACMIAEAIKAALPEAKNVQVDIATLRWTDTIKHRRIICLTPREAQHGLVCFDRGIEVKPFTFTAHAVQMLPAKRPGDKRVEKLKPRLEKPSPNETPDAAARRRRSKTQVQDDRRGLKRARVGENTAEFVILGGAPPPRHHPSRDRRFGLKAFTWD